MIMLTRSSKRIFNPMRYTGKIAHSYGEFSVSESGSHVYPICRRLKEKIMSTIFILRKNESSEETLNENFVQRKN